MEAENNLIGNLRGYNDTEIGALLCNYFSSLNADEQNNLITEISNASDYELERLKLILLIKACEYNQTIESNNSRPSMR